MFEGYRGFADYVQEYDLERSEGLLLRHLNSVYKVLRQTVPDAAKTDGVVEMELYLRDMLRLVDASLLEEWERMRDTAFRPAATDEPALAEAAEAPDVTRDPRSFTAAIRARMFAFLKAWSVGRDEEALALLDASADAGGEPWTAERLQAAREEHRLEHGHLRLDPEARNLRHTHVETADERDAWRVQQMLIDTEDANDWVLEVDVSLAASRAAGEPVVQLARLSSLV